MIKLFTNPDYDYNKDDFKAFEILHKGDQEQLKAQEYLWPHELELKPAGKQIRALREQRSAYTNWAEVLVSIWTSVAFRKDPIIPNEVSALLGDAIENIDGNGTGLISFIRDEIVKNLFVFGRPIIKVSAMGDRPETLADEQSGTTWQPYFEMVHPLAFKDWGLTPAQGTKFNRFSFCRVECEEVEERTSSKEKPEKNTYSKEYVLEEGKLVVYKYKLSKKNDLKDKEQAWELIGTLPLSEWDEIPIIAKFSESWLKDVTPHILKYYNTESVIDNIVLYQAHQRMFFIGPMDQTDKMIVSETSINILPEGSSVQVISPTDTTTIENRAQKILSNIFRIGLNMLKMQTEGAGIESADTLKQVKDSTVSLIQAEIEAVEDILNDAVRLFAKYKGKNDFKSEIRFNIEDLDNSIDEAVKLYSVFRDDISTLPKTKKAVLDWFIDRFDLNDKEELKQEIQEMMDSTSSEEMRKALEAEIMKSVVNQGLSARDGDNSK